MSRMKDFEPKRQLEPKVTDRPELSGMNPGVGSSEAEKNSHPSTLGTARCRAQPVDAKDDDNQEKQSKDIGTAEPIKGGMV